MVASQTVLIILCPPQSSLRIDSGG
jgi:hypothetical protein